MQPYDLIVIGSAGRAAASGHPRGRRSHFSHTPCRRRLKMERLIQGDPNTWLVLSVPY